MAVFGGGSDSAEWSGGGGGAGGSDYQHAISIYEESDSNQYSSSQPVLRVGHRSATSPGIEGSSHIDIQDDNDIHGHHEVRPRRNDDKNQKYLEFKKNLDHWENRLKIMKILKSSLKKKFKKFTSLHRVLDKFLGCLTPKENNGKQSKPSVGTNAKFPESSTPCLGLRKRKCSRSYARKQIGRISLARRELKRNRRQSWLCFGGGSDSAEWSGGEVGAGGDFGGQHGIVDR
ncbi:hypothetical protein LWI28_020700 [Acer negundo]|uniref:Uncharacterized protein n=1 Tax=Acer negundo TaxID=4023 RepID=A0AAD5J274_ACENE|nr:hypothetical protein LWI28_020700 [Acer negundo]